MGLGNGLALLTRTLLIDADIVAYQSAASNERNYNWGDGVTSQVADFDAAKKAAAEEIDRLMDTLKGTHAVICLSDDIHNFRKAVSPTYKGNRTGTRPEHLYDVKDWLATTYTTAKRPRLEADDVMGIMSTEPHKGERIIVSQDKDMQTIPGLLFNPGKDKKVRRITPEFAQRFMLWQALTGDATDGYPGCPGCGPKTADVILDEGMAWWKTERAVTRGARKGEIDVKWELISVDSDTWPRVVSAYRKAGLTEADAIIQVNLARILKHTDIVGNDVIPWVPADLI